jgi:hypothetical protein
MVVVNDPIQASLVNMAVRLNMPVCDCFLAEKDLIVCELEQRGLLLAVPATTLH